MKIFIGHSFDDRDSVVISKFLEFFRSREELEIVTGEKVQNRSVAEKVRDRISQSDAFAGIFTCDKEIKTGKAFLSKRNDYATSNWVIQESGFALGQDKPTILIVEKGIHRFPELQGDLELIYFNRKDLEEPFVKLNQMIDSLLSKGKVMPSVPVTEKLQATEKATEEDKGQERKTPVGQEDAFKRFWEAFDARNPTELREAYENDLVPAFSSDEEKKLVWKGVTLRIIHGWGDSEAYSELVELAENNKDRPKVMEQLAIRLKNMGEYGRAREKYLEAKDLYDIGDTGKKVNIIECYVEANKCLASQGKHREAIIDLSKLLVEESFKDQQAQLLKGLAEISRDSQDMEQFFIYAEESLNIDPTYTDLRFDLAYRYASKGHERLSLLHYKKLTDTVEHPMGFNNLGVQYDRLGLKGKSIASFCAAADQRITLATANLANRYLQEGFIKDAGDLIKRANKLSSEGVEVHGNVGFSKNKLDSQIREEDAREKEILIEAERERAFRIEYGLAFLCGEVVQRDDIEGTWETPWGNLEMSFGAEQNTVKAEQGTQLSSIKHRLVSIEGTIVNLSGTYDIKVIDTTKWSSGPSKDTFYNAVGYMVMSTHDRKTIHIMEKAKEDKTSFVIWRKR